MQGRSTSDRRQPIDSGATGPADRLSLIISVLLIGGLILASVALYQSAKIDRARPQKPLPAPVVRQVPMQSVARQPGVTGMVIQLPPPPVSSAASSSGAVKITPIQPTPILPAKRITAAKPVSEPVPSSAPPKKLSIKPLKAAPAIKADGKPSVASTTAMVDGAQNTKSGGALLRLLEHGQGPVIEIAWPRRADARRALYRQLTQCYGVKAAVLAGGARLFAATGNVGETWPINMDRFSGFIRSPQGEAIAEEARVFASIADRHRLTDWRPARVFPRHVDAALLGGLGAVLGQRYKTARLIHAAYSWDRSRLILGDFTVDGRPLTGSVMLPLPRGRARGPGCD